MSSISFRCKYLREEENCEFINETAINVLHPKEAGSSIYTGTLPAGLSLYRNGLERFLIKTLEN